MLGGWGMLIWVQGEGARAGETPPACLTAPPLSGDPNVTEAAETCRAAAATEGGGGAGGGGAAGGVLQDGAALQESHHLAGNDRGRTSAASSRQPPSSSASLRSLPKTLKSRPLTLDGAPGERTLTCSSWAGGVLQRQLWRADEKSDRCCFSHNFPNPASEARADVPEAAALAVVPPGEAGVKLLEWKRAAAPLCSVLSASPRLLCRCRSQL